MVVNNERLGPENDCADEDQQQLDIIHQSFRQKWFPTSTKLQLSDINDNLVMGRRGMPDSRRD
jgi:hypothetical protein